MSTTISTAERGDVNLVDVGMTYRRTGVVNKALAPTSLRLAPGSFTTLVGPSGCGKSTLLNVLAGFIRPTSGEARLDGAAITGPGPERGVVFQNYALFPWFTALGNVEFALRRHGLGRAERREKARHYLEAVGLAAGAKKYPAELSGGMQQRVALARTLASSPTLLLMDEPFGALDATTRQTMQTLLLDIWEKERTTVLFVTHDVDEALYLSDTIHVMSPTPGRIIRSFTSSAPRPRDISVLTPDQVEDRHQILGLIHRNH
jgi:NitT/TauT family transport system ATP-binding protein